MGIQGAGFGVSSLESTVEAVSEAVEKALQSLGGNDNDNNNNGTSNGTNGNTKNGHHKPCIRLAFCSTTVKHNVEQVRKTFVEKLPKGTLIHGITSSGSILTPGGAIANNSVGCLLLTTADKDAFCTAFDTEDGTKAAQALKAKMSSPQAIFMGATPGTEEGVLEALDKVFPGVPVFGGTAADDELTGEWKVFGSNSSNSSNDNDNDGNDDDANANNNNEQQHPASSETGVSLVAIGPSIAFGASMLGPYKATKQKAVATRTQGRRVFEIDHKPAADWVYQWLGGDTNPYIQDEFVNGGMILHHTAHIPIGLVVETPGPLFGLKFLAKRDVVTSHCAAFGGSNKSSSKKVFQAEQHKHKWVDFFTPIPQGSTLTLYDSGDGPATGYAKALSDAYDVARSNFGSTTTTSTTNGSSSSLQPKAALLVFCGGMAIAVGDNMNAGLTSPEFVNKTKDLPCLGMTCFGEQACLPNTKLNVQRNLSVGMILLG